MKRMILAVCLVAGALLAQGPGEGRRFGPAGAGMGPMGMNAQNATALKDFLGLSDAQIQQLKDLRTQEMQSLKPTMQEIATKRKALADLMKTANPDPAQVGQLTVDIKNLHASMQSARTDLAAKSLAVLTPDQQAKLKTLQNAQKLMPAVMQATALGLLTPPEGADCPGCGGPGGRGPAGMGPGGRAGMRRFGPPAR